jgi:gamma-glutamylcyclotransferase (GGCT)/AIG2-like uncharacterized protein YtfP
MEQVLVSLFVYGSLKRGQVNHARCADHLGAVEAAIPGRLWTLPDGWPALEVSPGLRLAMGTLDYEEDAALSRSYARAVRTPVVEPPWRWIRGEVLTFDDPTERLPALDRFEGYDADGHSLYERWLVPVRRADGGWMAAWTYLAPLPVPTSWAALDAEAWP